MTGEEPPSENVTMEPNNNNGTLIAPLASLSSTPMEDILEEHGVKKKGGTFPRMAHFDVPEDTPPNSQNGTLKAKETHPPQRQNGSLKGPWNRRAKGKAIPVKEADTAKVLEMYLKRRSKSMNDAVLTREYFSQEKKRKVRSTRNNTVSICSTISTDSTASEVQIHSLTTREASVEMTSGDVDKTVFSRKSTTQQSFHEAMKCSIMEEGSTPMEQSADDELSSPDETSPRSRSAPSTLRMQIRRDDYKPFDTLQFRDNGTATLTRDGYKRDSKKEPRRKRSFLDKAKQIIRSPGTSRKIVRTPSATQRHEEREKEKEKERLREIKEREKREKEEEKERLKKEKQEKEQLEKRLKELEKERKEREKEKLKEMERRMKELKERRERDELARKHTRHYARTEVHHEMKKTGFTARLKETFRRSTREKHRHRELPPRPTELPSPSDSQGSKESKSKRWPGFHLKRRSRKSASTPTDESGGGATGGATTPSDTASMDFEYYAAQPEYTRSLNDTERRRLLIEMRRSVRREASSGTHSDSQILDRHQSGHPLLTQARSHDSVGSFASSEGSERLERPKTLAFRKTRAERAQRGLNNVIRLDSTTPGHMRRDVDTSQPLLPIPPALPPAFVADDLVRDGGGLTRPQGAEGGASGDDRNVTDSWTESGDGSDIPFDQRNQAEREEYFKRIADRLAMIGDQALADYEFQEQGGGAAHPGTRERPVSSVCYQESYASCTAQASGGAVGGVPSEHSTNYVAIGTRIRTDVDGMQARRRSMALFPAQMVMSVILNETYQSFSSTMQQIVGQEVGWEQLAIVFKFTKVAVKAAHSMGKHASCIKNNSVRFIGDRFAGWLESEGGWGSVVTSEDSGDESLHEESEID